MVGKQDTGRFTRTQSSTEEENNTVSDDFVDVLRTIRRYTTQLLAQTSSTSTSSNQTVNRLVFNARDSLKSALNFAGRSQQSSTQNENRKATALDENVVGRDDAESIGSDILDLEDEIENEKNFVADVTPEKKTPDKPKCDEFESSNDSVDLLNFSSIEKIIDKNESCNSSGNNKSAAFQEKELDVSAFSSVSNANVTVDEFDDINFDEDDFSNDGVEAGTDADFSHAVMPDDADLTDVEADGDQNTIEEIDDDAQNQPEDPSYSRVLKQYFGYSKFRPLQWKIINSVLNDKKDCCVIMATVYWSQSECLQRQDRVMGTCDDKARHLRRHDDTEHPWVPFCRALLDMRDCKRALVTAACGSQIGKLLAVVITGVIPPMCHALTSLQQRGGVNDDADPSYYTTSGAPHVHTDSDGGGGGTFLVVLSSCSLSFFLAKTFR